MIVPNKLKEGDLIRVVSPSRSMAIISDDVRELANKRLEDLGLRVSFSKHCEEMDDFASSSVESRLEDVHEAFADPEVKGILTTIGGFNCNQLLKYLDYDLIKSNPKIISGYSDTTALQNAIYSKTGLIVYSGLCYSIFGMKKHFDYNLSYFKKCVMSDESFEIKASETWSDDEWYLDQENRVINDNEGYWCINEGEAEAKVIGGNLCTLNLLQGTEFMPDIKDSILFLEDDMEAQPYHFDRDLQSLIHLSDFGSVKGIVIGRFQKASEVTRDLLTKIIKTKRELNDIPVIANANFGHVNPIITFPIGGTVRMQVKKDQISIGVVRH